MLKGWVDLEGEKATQSVDVDKFRGVLPSKVSVFSKGQVNASWQKVYFIAVAR
jgi:hypothetical protein